MAALLAIRFAIAIGHRPSLGPRSRPRESRDIIHVNCGRAILQQGPWVDIFGIRLSGFVAWMLWRGVYLLKFPTLSRKLRILFEWIWTCLFPPHIAHLSLSRTTLLRPATSKHTEVSAKRQ